MVMDGFRYLNCGISLYKLKYNVQDSFDKGGKIPLNNSHSVIDNPESVSLVSQPTTIIKKTNVIIDKSHTLTN